MATQLVGELVECAAHGDAAAWEEIVDRYAGLVWAVTRGYGLSRADAADVSQTTWLRLAEHLDRIRDPESIGAWLATTARHEALRLVRVKARHVAMDAVHEAVVDTDPDERLIREERYHELWRALEALPPPCKTLLRVLCAEPPPSYAEVSAALSMPIGSIGPTRNRCLDRLRKRAGSSLADVPRWAES